MKVRLVYGAPSNLPFDITKAVENIHKIDDTLSFDVVTDEEANGRLAWYEPKEDTIFCPETIYRAAMDHNPRQRFTFAHEFAHSLLHRSDSLNRIDVSVKVETYEDPEWQANNLAAAILMPKSGVLEIINDHFEKTGKNLTAVNKAHHDVVQTYKVSYTAAKHRIKRLLGTRLDCW